MNLHAIVRGIIPAVNPDESVVWYRSTGQQASGYGEIEPTYADPVTVAAQVQSEGDEAAWTPGTETTSRGRTGRGGSWSLCWKTSPSSPAGRA